MSLPFNPDTSVQLPAENTFTSSTDATNLNDWTKSGLNLYNTSIGNVGIGTTATATYKLNVNGSLNTTSLYQNNTLINFANFATDSELTTGLGTKQDKINAYVLSIGSVSSLGFSSGTLTLVLPNNYSSLTINNLTTSTSFSYKGSELSTTLNNYTPFTALLASNYVRFPQLLSCNYTNFPQLLSCNYITNSTTGLNNYPSYSAIGLSNFVNFPQLLSSNYITNSTTGLNNYPSYSALALSNYVNFPQLLSSNYITNATTGLTNYYNKTETNTLLNTKQANLTFSSPLVNTTNNITFNESSITSLTNFYNKTNADLRYTQSNFTPSFNQLNSCNYTPFSALQQSNYATYSGLNSCNYITNATTGLTNYYNKTETNTLLNTKQANLTFSSPLVNTTNNITFNESSITSLTNFYNKTNADLRYTQSNFTPSFNQLNSCNYITNATTGLTNYTRTGLDDAYLLKSGGVMSGQITGVSTLNATTGLFGTIATTNNTNVALPSLGVQGGIGDKLIFYAGTPTNHPFSLGINTNSLWYSVPSGASHNFYIGGGNAKMSISSSGNIGIGVITNISSKLTINDIVIDRWTYDHSTSPLTITNQTTTGTTLNDPQPILNLCRQGLNNVSFGARATFKLCRYENSGFNSRTKMDIALAHNSYEVETNVMSLRSDGNVGIGVLNPTQILQVGGGGRLRLANNNSDYSIIGTADTDGGTNTRIVLSGNTRPGFGGQIDYVATAGGSHIFSTTNNTTERMRISDNGDVNISTILKVQSHLIYNYLFNSSGFNHNTITNFNDITHFGYRFIQGNTNAPNTSASQWYQWFIGLGIEYPATGANSHGCQFATQRNNGNPFLYVRFKENNFWGSWYSIRVDNATQATSLAMGDQTIGGNITCNLISVDYVGYDDVGVLDVSGIGQNNNKTLRQIWNSFTAFHRCFTDDQLFEIDNPQQFKDDYMGRIVVSTGTIKTHSSKLNENGEVEWEIKTGKGAIVIEDAHPTIELSRKKKDKRILGVLGLNTRNNSSPERLIVNSIGEGAVWCINSSGNFENGDLITTSIYLGYGELQDDDLIHNYTLGKITMDCDFQLNSSLYECKEIDEINPITNEKLRIAFVACVYYSG